MCLISVIIPAYNAQETIKETIESVLKQTLSSIELIIINSSSTDATLEVISKIDDSRIKVYNYSKANVAVNRNRGFNHATSDFITFIDADDIWVSNKLEAQYKAFMKNPDVGVVYSWTNCIDENGKFLRKCSHVRWSGDVYSKFLLDDFIGSGSNVMIRRQAYIEVGGFDESLTNAQDTDMWLRLSARYNFALVPEAQILYRIRNDSMSSNVVGLEKSNLTIIERAFAHHKAENLQHLKRYSIANLYKYLSYKALDTVPGKHNSFQIIKFILLAVKTDYSLLRKPIIYKSIFKLIVMSLFPPSWSDKFLNRFPRIFNTSTFLGYEKIY